MPLLEVGYIRLALLDDLGNKAKTLILPPPESGSLELDWAEKAHTWDLDDGGELTRKIGYLPVLSCKWMGYDELPGIYPLGTGDGQRPVLEDLLWFLSQPSGRTRVSPGLTAGGFTVDRVQLKPIGRKGLVYTGIQAIFRATKARTFRDLEVF